MQYIGGDQLTAARIRSSQRVRSNSQRGLDRLEGVVPVIEDWHSKGILLTVICIIILTLLLVYVLYKCSNRKQTLGWLITMHLSFNCPGYLEATV